MMYGKKSAEKEKILKFPLRLGEKKRESAPSRLNDRGFSSRFISWNLFSHYAHRKKGTRTRKRKPRNEKVSLHPLWSFFFVCFFTSQKPQIKNELKFFLVLLLILIYKSSSLGCWTRFNFPRTERARLKPIEMVLDECCPLFKHPFFGGKSRFSTPQLDAREAHIFLMVHHHFALSKVPNKIFNYSYFCAFDALLSHFHYHLIHLGACCLYKKIPGRMLLDIKIKFYWWQFFPSREKERKKVINESY